MDRTLRFSDALGQLGLTVRNFELIVPVYPLFRAKISEILCAEDFIGDCPLKRANYGDRVVVPAC